MRILLVEDNADHRELMSLALTGHDPTWQVNEVESGEEALRRLAEGEAYDVVFLDYSLPGRDGLEVLKEIRRGEAPPPVLMVTGRGDEQVAVEAMKGGAYDYVTKVEGYPQRLPVVAQRAVEAYRLATERKRAEEALWESEEKYRTILDNIEDGYFEVDLAGNLTFFNDSLCRMLGYSRDEMMGMNNRQYMDKEGAKRVFREFNRVYTTGKPAKGFDWEIIRKDGVRRIIESPISLIKNSEGEPIGFRGIARDVTERKRAEEALRESEQRLTVALKNAPMVVAHVDRNLRYTWIHNPHPDFKPEDAIGKRDDELAQTEGAFRLTELKRQVLDGGIPARREISFMLSDRERVYDIYAEPKSDSAGKIIGLTTAALDITERKRAEEEIRQRTTQLEALRQVGLELTAQLDLDTLLHSIASQAIELLGGTSGGLYFYRLDKEVLERVVSIDLYASLSGTVLHRGEGLSGKVWETGEPLIVDDYHHWEGRAAGFEDYSFTAVVGVPVRWGEEFLGVLEVMAEPPRTFSPADADLLSLFASQAAIAIQNARLFEAEREQRELAEALEEAAATVSSTLDLDEVLDRILEQVERVVAGDALSVMLIEDDIAHLARWRGYELPGERTQPLRFDIPMAKYPNLIKMARTGKPVIVPDTALDPDWVPAARDQEWRRSYVGVPIRLGGATVGFLGVSGTRPGQFGPEDARRMEGLASHAAAAIENARLYDEIQQKVEELGLLLDTVTAASSTLEPDRILRTLADKMTTSVGATFCRIALLDEMNQSLTIRTAFAAHDLDWDPGLGRRYALADAPWHRQVIERGQIMIMRQDDSSKAVSEMECRMALREDIQSALLMPLVVGDRTLGVVSLGEIRSWERIPFTADRVRLCQAMANQAAVAIRNAQLLDAVMKHKRDLQELSTQLINAQEVERRRLSQGLHDEMGQALTMMNINLAAIEKELPSELAPTIRERLAEATSLVTQTLEQVRELSLDLRPTMLDDLGLVSTLR